VVLSAAATSVPDTIISMKDARKGNYDDAVSNVLFLLFVGTQVNRELFHGVGIPLGEFLTHIADRIGDVIY